MPKTTNSGPQWVSRKEIAEHFGLPVSFFEVNTVPMGIPHIRTGRYYRYNVKAVTEFFSKSVAA